MATKFKFSDKVIDELIQSCRGGTRRYKDCRSGNHGRVKKLKSPNLKVIYFMTLCHEFETRKIKSLIDGHSVHMVERTLGLE